MCPHNDSIPPLTPDPFPGTGHAGSRQRRCVWSPENGVFCGILVARLAEKRGENAPHHRKCPEMLQTRLESRLERKVNAEYEKGGLGSGYTASYYYRYTLKTCRTSLCSYSKSSNQIIPLTYRTTQVSKIAFVHILSCIAVTTRAKKHKVKTTYIAYP